MTQTLLGLNLVDFFEDIRAVTMDDHTIGHTEDDLFRDLIEEIGEYARARTIEKGIKIKPLDESSKGELVDVLINIIALHKLRGGTIEELTEYGPLKLAKWKERLKRIAAARSNTA